jgi:hypothetical protein
MNPDAYWHIVGASIAGGVAGVLVMWNRKRTEIAGENKLRGFSVLVIGTAAFTFALHNLTMAINSCSQIYAITVMIITTGWVAVVYSVVPLLIPDRVLKVRAGEFVVLQSPWTGVRLFGTLLRKTPLRYLGGRVFLMEESRDLGTVIRGIHDAESVHIWALLFCFPWLVYWGVEGRWMMIVWGLAVHVPMNVYPILHLRYVSWRIERYAARLRRNEVP